MIRQEDQNNHRHKESRMVALFGALLGQTLLVQEQNLDSLRGADRDHIIGASSSGAQAGFVCFPVHNALSQILVGPGPAVTQIEMICRQIESNFFRLRPYAHRTMKRTLQGSNHTWLIANIAFQLPTQAFQSPTQAFQSLKQTFQDSIVIIDGPTT